MQLLYSKQLPFLAFLCFFGIPESYLQLPQTPYTSDDEALAIALHYDWGDAIPQKTKMDIPRAAFGKKLFFDPRLSQNGNIACASCHSPGLSFTDGKKHAVGSMEGSRNTPTLINVFSGHWFFWDGRADSLTGQALGPLESSIEHNSNRGQIAWLIQKFYKPDYEAVFGVFPKHLAAKLKLNSETEAKAMPAPTCENSACLPLEESLATYAISTISDFTTQNTFILKAGKLGIQPQELLSKRWTKKASIGSNIKWNNNFEALTDVEKKELNEVFVNAGRALSAYQNGIIAIDSPFDRFVRKLASQKGIDTSFDEDFSQRQWQGFKTFISSGCTNCHNGPNFTDQQFHNIGLAWQGPLDLGRAVGLKKLKASEFGCLEPNLESCQERTHIRENNQELVGAFKTPTLRNLDTSKPYMHDGRFGTLEEVIDHYLNPPSEAAIGHRSESLKTISLESEDRENLILFLESLNSKVQDLTEE